MNSRIPVPHDRIATFCRANGIRRFSLFGSVLREDFGADSDVDVLVEFAPGVRFGLLGLARMERELGDILGRKADLHAPGWLKEWMRREVLNTAELIHESPE